MSISEIWQRFVYGNFVQGFFDIRYHANSWWNIVNQRIDSPSVSGDVSYRFFNDMVTSIQRYVDYPDYWCYDQGDRAGYL